MKVEIILTVYEIDKFELKEKIAVVIDTLRATSTIVTALYNGAKFVRPVFGGKDAFAECKKLKPDTYLLCGERNGIKIEGFDLGNSPLEYSSEVVKDKEILLSTTNGTMTIEKSARADRVLIGSLLNEKVTVNEIISLDQNLVLCCSGTGGHFSLEDFVTAGAYIGSLKDKGISIEGDDRVQTAYLLYERYVNQLVDLMSCSQNGTRLVNIGQLADVQFCARQNKFPIVCYYDGDRIYI